MFWRYRATGVTGATDIRRCFVQDALRRPDDAVADAGVLGGRVRVDRMPAGAGDRRRDRGASVAGIAAGQTAEAKPRPRQVASGWLSDERRRDFAVWPV